MAGGDPQTLHQDYNDQAKKFQDHLPLAVIVALSDEVPTRLLIEGFNTSPKHSKSLNAGDMIIFHGFAKHAGVSYQKENIRVHFYCTHKNVREKDYSRITYL